MINLLEAAVVAVMVLFAIAGFRKGFVKKFAAMVSLALSIVLVSALLPYITQYLKENTPVYTFLVEQCTGIMEKQVLNSLTGSGSGAGTNSGSAADAYANMGRDEIRALLEQNGFDSTMLDQLSDEQLEVYKNQYIQQYLNQYLSGSSDGSQDSQGGTKSLTRIEQTEIIENLPLPEQLKDILLDYNNDEGYKGLGVSSFPEYMARHSFIQMSKLSNVKGRISYITSHAKQENLYATYRTADNEFWSNLARESQQEFKRSGTEGKCIEARELIIALPEVYTRYEPQEVLEDFTEEFRKRYGVECVSALHHNKRKTNYHIHLIFSERKLLPEPDIKRATRSVFYDETGKRVRTKKEITGEDGQIRKGCTVIKKGEVYESHLFTVKDDKFKSEPFLREIKEIYTDLINRHISDPEQQLKVFDKNSVYLPTKKIGKNNPKAAEIEADNTARQEWNRTADMALLSGISEAKILEVKQTEIHEKASQSIKSKGWLPNLFRGIVAKAKDFLQNLIREKDMPPKPTLDIDMAEFRHMRNLMIKVQDKAKKIKNLQDKVLPHLKQQLADTKGLFKGKERKALEVKIKETEVEIADRLDKIPDTLKADGYPDVQVFMRTFREMESVVEQYNRDLAEWEYQVSRKPTAATKEQHRPPERQSVLKHLREIQERNKQQPPQRQYKKSIDRDSR